MKFRIFGSAEGAFLRRDRENRVTLPLSVQLTFEGVYAQDYRHVYRCGGSHVSNVLHRGNQRGTCPIQEAGKDAAAPTYGNAEAITENELKVYDYFLASDQLEGRNLPSRGYDTAALYVASHLAEWGLKPGGSSTGTNGPLQPYFMPIETGGARDCSRR